jgi:hypothetical protein
VPCAIVVNKVDAFDLESKIGKEPAKVLLNNPDTKTKTTEAAISELTRDYLVQHGMNNFIRNIELTFKKTRYFSCSSLGHLPDGNSFKPIRVLDPFNWIVSHFDSKLRKCFESYAKDDIIVKIPHGKILSLENGDKYLALSSSAYNGKQYYYMINIGEDPIVIKDNMIIAKYECGKKRRDPGNVEVVSSVNAPPELKRQLKITDWIRKMAYYKTHQSTNV